MYVLRQRSSAAHRQQGNGLASRTAGHSRHAQQYHQHQPALSNNLSTYSYVPISATKRSSCHETNLQANWCGAGAGQTCPVGSEGLDGTGSFNSKLALTVRVAATLVKVLGTQPLNSPPQPARS